MVSANDGWAVCSDGTIIHWDGTRWNTVTSPTTNWLLSVNMVNSADGWVVGDYGTIIHWDGESWTNVTSPTTHWLWSVDMVSATDGWAVGSNGTIIRWDGTRWKTVTSPTANWLCSVNMVSANDGWAVCSDGTIIHWDGTNWNTVTSPTANSFWSVNMVSANDGWAVGSSGMIIRWIGEAPLVASFSASHETQEVNEPIEFDASESSDPDGTIVNYAWNFGEGTTASGMTSTHTYSSEGTYTVTLTVTDNNELTDTATKTITIIPSSTTPTVPDASFTFPSVSQGVNQPATFDASGSSDPDGNIVSYEWSFGDGSTGTGMTEPHTYTSDGTFTVTLTVTDNDGHKDTATKTIIINPAPTTPTTPDAYFTFTSENQVVNQPITFDASGSSDPDGTIDNYAWNFGDGTTGTGMTSTHAYSSEGTYTVTLTVTDNDDQTGTAAQNLEIIVDMMKPKADAGEDLVVKDGKTITFNASRSSDNVGIVSYEWEFGDGNTGTGETPTHVYEKGGTYTVILTVTDASGNTDTFILVITVEDPAAGFPYWVLILIIIGLIVAAVVVWYFLKKRKTEVPKPAKIKMTVDSTEILADGNSTANITVELQDEKGKPMKALVDTKVNLTTTGGTIKNPVVNVPKDKEKGTTVLIASTAAGKVMLSATAKGLKRADTTVTFMEKQRFCMHCGNKMSFTSKYCPECGKSPPAGVDTKACKNCNAVIPAVANFCAECGASQPKE